MNQKKASYTKRILLIAVLCIPVFSFLFWVHDQNVSAKTQDTYKYLEEFSNVLSIVEQNYVEEVDTKDLIQGAIKGMLTSLDPHSSYMKPDEFKELKVETEGSFHGIGIEITIRDNVLTVVSPIEGTPASKKGLKAGDKIIMIEGEPTKDMTLNEAVKKLRGPKGTKVTISIHREGWNELKDITIVRDVIPLHSVKSKLLEPGYPYIRIINFQAKTTTDFKKALQDFDKDGDIQGLIIDLRNNPGGLLDQAVKIADIFIDEGVIVSTKGRIKEQNTVFEATDNGDHYNFPMVVLVNEGSASASEIVAGALQDHKKALILGAQTFGKGSVQTIIPMSNGAGLRLTTARYYTPNGTSIQAKGITPDIVVPTQVVTEQPAKEVKKPHFLREKDLRHHISNGNDDQVDKQDDEKMDDEKQIEDQKPESGTDEQTPDEKEALKRDRQLSTALMLLKGVNVFEANN